MNELKKTLFEKFLEHDVALTVQRSLCKGIPSAPSDLSILEYGLHKPNPILDLTIGDDGIRSILSFNQTPTHTFVPWQAVIVLFCPAVKFQCVWATKHMEVHISIHKNEHPIVAKEPASKRDKVKPKLSIVR